MYLSVFLPTNCLSVFDHFVWLVLKGLKKRSPLYCVQNGPHSLTLDFVFCYVDDSQIKRSRSIEKWRKTSLFGESFSYLNQCNDAENMRIFSSDA